MITNILHGVRLLCSVALLVAVYNGSRLALVVLLALVVIASEVQGWYWERVLLAAKAADHWRSIAFREDRETTPPEVES